MNTARIGEVLRHIGVTPVLVDVGASGGAPVIWKNIASKSLYIGFDPDLREMKVDYSSGFLKSVILNEAVAGPDAGDSVEFLLTASPFCSSTLEPNHESLADYFFAPLFDVERRTTVKATTLAKVLDRLALPSAHWIKIDTQGTDLRILKGMGEKLASVLAVDMEPGIIDGAHGEDQFVDVHREMVREGFWLSDMKVCGSIRMRRQTRSMLEAQGFQSAAMQSSIRTSPGWCEIRYLRTIKYLQTHLSGNSDYGLLWVFAMLDQQAGYALDLAISYRDRFGEDPLFSLMYDSSLEAIQTAPIYKLLRTFGRFKSMLPPGLKRIVKQTLSGNH